MKFDIYQNAELLLLQVIKLFQEAASGDKADAKVVEMTLGKYREVTAFCFIVGSCAFVVVVDWPVENAYSCQCATRELYDILMKNKWTLIKLEHANLSYTPRQYATRIYNRLTNKGKINQYLNLTVVVETAKHDKTEPLPKAPNPLLTEDTITVFKKVDRFGNECYIPKLVSSVTRQELAGPDVFMPCATPVFED